VVKLGGIAFVGGNGQNGRFVKSQYKARGRTKPLSCRRDAGNLGRNAMLKRAAINITDAVSHALAEGVAMSGLGSGALCRIIVCANMREHTASIFSIWIVADPLSTIQRRAESERQ
jgi:hypothetical protein